MRLRFLSNKIPWFGKYSGYECLPNYFHKKTAYEIISSKNNKIEKIIGKIYQIKNGWYGIRPEEISSGMRFYRKIDENSISHILYLENHIHLLERDLKASKLLATIHLPIRQWKTDNLRLLSKLQNAILLYKEELQEFSEYINIDNLHVLKHGVDTDFFAPATANKVNKNKMLFVGHYLRNFDMFYKVYNQIHNNISSSLEYHFIIPGGFRTHPVLQKLTGYKNFFFHQNLSDDELLAHYQSSYLLLMPMNDSGANTAIVQALSTGLPILTTDVGGIRSYGGSNVFPIVKQNDHISMAELFNKYYHSEDYRNEIAVKQREFSLNYLGWESSANDHIDLYNKIFAKGIALNLLFLINCFIQ